MGTHIKRGAGGKILTIGALSAGLFLLVWLYGSGLRDPRYLDGWLLAGGMTIQLSFHLAAKAARLSPRSAARWRALHIVVGFALVAAFLSHSNFSLPDSGFEWSLWVLFVIVTLSGMAGAYLSWSLKSKRLIDERVGFDSISERRAALAQAARAVVAMTDQPTLPIELPIPPHDAWIRDFYVSHLKGFFERPQNAAGHLVGSQVALKSLIDEIDALSKYVDGRGQQRLAHIKSIVVEKDRLDVEYYFQRLTRSWLLIHVPVTYALVALTVVHVLVVYSFSSGDW